MKKQTKKDKLHEMKGLMAALKEKPVKKIKKAIKKKEMSKKGC